MKPQSRRPVSSGRKVRYYIEYLVFRGIEMAIRLMPEIFLVGIARFFAFLGFKVLRYRRAVSLGNLAAAFPEKSAAERYRLAYRSYRHFAMLMLEFMKLTGWSLEKLERRLELDIPPEVQEWLDRRGQEGAIVVSGHFGNWEVGAALLAAGYFNGLAGIIKQQRNFYLDQYFIEMRRRWGMELIYARGAIAACLQALQRNRLVGLLCDQDGGKKGVFVPFFGQMSSTPAGAALLHLKSGAPLFFAYSIRKGNFRYKGVIRPVIYKGAYEVNDENIREVTAIFTAMLEAHVRRHPEQYLWTHRRWKTRPENPGGTSPNDNGTQISQI